jgi:hypothetical protein
MARFTPLRSRPTRRRAAAGRCHRPAPPDGCWRSHARRHRTPPGGTTSSRSSPAQCHLLLDYHPQRQIQAVRHPPAPKRPLLGRAPPCHRAYRSNRQPRSRRTLHAPPPSPPGTVVHCHDHRSSGPPSRRYTRFRAQTAPGPARASQRRFASGAASTGRPFSKHRPGPASIVRRRRAKSALSESSSTAQPLRTRPLAGLSVAGSRVLRTRAPNSRSVYPPPCARFRRARLWVVALPAPGGGGVNGAEWPPAPRAGAVGSGGRVEGWQRR